MVDLLIRDVPDDVVAAIDARAKRLGLSRTEFLRRQLTQAATRSGERVSTRTDSPLSRRPATTWLPTVPVPPSTRCRMICLSCAFRRLCSES